MSHSDGVVEETEINTLFAKFWDNLGAAPIYSVATW
jgi:hypothetical protein